MKGRMEREGEEEEGGVKGRMERKERERSAHTSAWFPAWELLLVPVLLPGAGLKVLINTAIAMNIHFTR